MKLQTLTESQFLGEMAAKKTCPTCGHGMAGFHYWYKGAWKCKSSSLANPNIATATQVTTSPPASTPAPKVTPTPAAVPAPAVDLTTPIGGVKTIDMDAIKYFLNTKYIRNYTIEADGTVNVNGDVHITGCGAGMPHLPVTFGEIKGNFSTEDVAFSSFKGFPNKVTGHVTIKRAIIVDDYVGFPSFIGGLALIKNIKAKSLNGFPKYIAGRAEITISGNKHSLGEVGEFGSSLYLNVEDAPLSSLDGLQETIHGSLEIKAKGVASLKDFPTDIKGDVILVVNTEGDAAPTKQMHRHVKKIGGRFVVLVSNTTPLRDKKDFPPLLSVVLIKGIKEFSFADSTYGQSIMTPAQREFERQINNAIAENQDIHELQEQLIDSGFGKAARL